MNPDFKHFKEKTTYQDKIEIDDYDNESYIISFYPDGKLELYREHHRVSDSMYGLNYTDLYNNYTGTYEILKKSTEEENIAIHINKEATNPSKNINTDCELNYSDVDYRFEFIRTSSRKHAGFTYDNPIFRIILHLTDLQFYSKQIELLKRNELSEEQATLEMVKYSGDLKKYLSDRYPDLQFTEAILFCKEKNFLNSSDEEIMICLIQAKGDFFNAYELLNSFFAEFKLLMISDGVTADNNEILNIYIACPNKFDPSHCYRYYKRYTLYKNENEELKEYYDLTDDEQNLKILVDEEGRVKDVVRQLKPELYYLKELNQLVSEGFTNNSKNKEIITGIPFDLEYENLKVYFQVKYDEKMNKDFEKLSQFDNILIDKISLDSYYKNNGNIFLTALELKYPGLLETYGDILPSETLAYAAQFRYSYIDNFVNEVSSKVEFFTSKGITLTELEVMKLFAYTNNNSDDSLFDFYQNQSKFQEKCEIVKKNYPQYNDYEIMKALYDTRGNIPLALCIHFKIDMTEAFNEEFKKIHSIPGLGGCSDQSIYDVFMSYRYENVEANMNNIIAKLKFGLDPVKSGIYDQFSDYPDLLELYDFFEKNNWDLYWGKLFVSYRHVYEEFKNDKQIDSETLYQLSSEQEGNLDSLREVFK